MWTLTEKASLEKHFFIFERESNEFKGECIELSRGCTGLLGGSSILQGGDQTIK